MLFRSLRGNVRTLRCDNGTNFVGACNELLNSFQNMICDPRIKEFLLQHKCDFRFNPPESSHFWGTWERMIRSVRNVFSGLSSQINERLDSSSLRTLFYECMAIINSYSYNLQTRQKWHSKTRNLKVNDIVIVSDQCSRLDWHLGKVVKAAPHKDGLVRQVHILLFDKMSGKHVNLVGPVTV